MKRLEDSLFNAIRLACITGIDRMRAANQAPERRHWTVLGGKKGNWRVILPVKSKGQWIFLDLRIKLRADSCDLTIGSCIIAKKRSFQRPTTIKTNIPITLSDEQSITRVFEKSFDWLLEQLSAPRGGAN